MAGASDDEDAWSRCTRDGEAAEHESHSMTGRELLLGSCSTSRSFCDGAVAGSPGAGEIASTLTAVHPYLPIGRATAHSVGHSRLRHGRARPRGRGRIRSSAISTAPTSVHGARVPGPHSGRGDRGQATPTSPTSRSSTSRSAARANAPSSSPTTRWAEGAKEQLEALTGERIAALEALVRDRATALETGAGRDLRASRYGT